MAPRDELGDRREPVELGNSVGSDVDAALTFKAVHGRVVNEPLDRAARLLPYRLPPGPCGFGCGNGSASAGVAAMTAMARIAAIIFWLPIAIASKAHSPDLF
jgi:hypothetical protein